MKQMFIFALSFLLFFSMFGCSSADESSLSHQQTTMVSPLQGKPGDYAEIGDGVTGTVPSIEGLPEDGYETTCPVIVSPGSRVVIKNKDEYTKAARITFEDSEGEIPKEVIYYLRNNDEYLGELLTFSSNDRDTWNQEVEIRMIGNSACQIIVYYVELNDGTTWGVPIKSIDELPDDINKNLTKIGAFFRITTELSARF